ncbi:MAG: lipase family protein [Gammaproteobacteria bacterium]
MTVAALTPAFSSTAAAQSSPRVGVTGPTGDAFYAPPVLLPGKQHGDLVWSRNLDNPDMSLKNAKNILVMYRSEAADGTPIGVTGIVSVPNKAAPAGGFPILSYTHGTVGVTDICAPSKSREGGPQGPYAYGYNMLQHNMLQLFLDAGWVVVRTDYEGLGPPDRTHPYVSGPSEAHGALDIARAARQLFPGQISTKLGLAGHSQGGHAALWSGSMQPTYVPEFKLVGVAAMAAGSNSAQAAALALQPIKGFTVAFLPMLLNAFLAENPKYKPEGILSAKGLALWSQLEQRCAEGLRKEDSWAGQPANEMFQLNSPVFLEWAKYMAANSAMGLKINAPVRYSASIDDEVVPFAWTVDLAAVSRSVGNDVQEEVIDQSAPLPPGLTRHFGQIITDGPRVFRWLQAKLETTP